MVMLEIRFFSVKKKKTQGLVYQLQTNIFHNLIQFFIITFSYAFIMLYIFMF